MYNHVTTYNYAETVIPTLLDHPNIMKVYDVRYVNQKQFVFMESGPRQTLDGFFGYIHDHSAGNIQNIEKFLLRPFWKVCSALGKFILNNSIL
jgi:hypothetical protein